MLKILRQKQNVPAKLENEATFSVPEHIVFHRHQDGLVLLDAYKGLIFTANRSAAMIWDGISQGQTVKAIAARLSAESGLPCERMLEDTRTYLRELQQRGLVFAGAKN